MYYYLLSSLPYLQETTEHLPSPEDFLELSRDHLTEKHFQVLQSARLDGYQEPYVSNRFLRDYYRIERALLNEVARERARRTNFGFEPFEADGASWYRERLVGAVSSPSPLNGEMALMSIRFRIITELEAGRYFSFENVLAYYLRLQILHRKRNMNRERGEEAFTSTYQTIARPLSDEGGLSVGV